MRFNPLHIIILVISIPFTSSSHDNIASSVNLMVGDINISANHISLENKIVKANGNVYCTSENFFAKCDEASCEMTSKEISAKSINMHLPARHFQFPHSVSREIYFEIVTQS